MAATKTPARKTSAGSPEAVSRRNASATANTNRVIDFGETLPETAFGTPSRWGQTLDQLYVAVRDGNAVLGSFYKVGEFVSESGANTCRNDIQKNPAKLIRGEFNLRSRTVTNDPNGYKSQLWAAVTRLATEDQTGGGAPEGGDEAEEGWE